MTDGPVYAGAAALVFVYSWGWRETFIGVFGIALGVLVGMAEFLKPRIGPLIEDRWSEGTKSGRAKAGFLILAAVTCIGFGGISSFVAFNAARAPQAAYEAGQRAVVSARAELVTARNQLAAFNCTPDMPAERCERNRAANAGAEGRAERSLADREADLAEAERLAPPAPLIGVPELHWSVKLIFGFGIDFLLFAIPWAAREGRPAAGRVVEAPANVERVAAAATPVETVVPPVVKSNDGGWATRRAKYGPNGQRKKRKPKLRIAGGTG